MKTDHTQTLTHTTNPDIISIPQTQPKPLIRAAAYCRVSTDDPEQIKAINTALQKIRK